MDIVDYVNWGHIGCGSNSNLPTKDLNWDEAYITFNATKDAFYKVIKEYIGSAWAMMWTYSPVDEEPILDISDAITEEGELVLSSNMSILGQKMLNFEYKSNIFWNTLLSVENKKTGIHEYDTLIFKLENIDLTGGFSDTFLQVITVSIDYTDKQELNSTIYKEYIESLSDLVTQFKTIYILLTGSSLETFIP